MGEVTGGVGRTFGAARAGVAGEEGDFPLEGNCVKMKSGSPLAKQTTRDCETSSWCGEANISRWSRPSAPWNSVDVGSLIGPVVVLRDAGVDDADLGSDGEGGGVPASQKLRRPTKRAVTRIASGRRIWFARG